MSSVLLLEAARRTRRPSSTCRRCSRSSSSPASTGTCTASEEPGLGGRRLYLPRGRVIGGSSSINAMIYLRGNRADFDEWAAHGCTGWSYDEVLPYFKRSEDNERGESEFHGVGGPLDGVRQPLDAPVHRGASSRPPCRPGTSTSRT